MAIDPNKERLLSLRDAARLLPRRRGGKRPHISCLYRWTTGGCKNVILESFQCGGTRCTSREALARFIRRLTEGNSAAPSDAPKVRSVAQRQRATTKALRELEQDGV
jgi:hypothetical protein